MSGQLLQEDDLSDLGGVLARFSVFQTLHNFPPRQESRLSSQVVFDLEAPQEYFHFSKRNTAKKNWSLDNENPFDSCTKCRRALLSEQAAPHLSPRQESNLHRLLRREASYPLNDEEYR